MLIESLIGARLGNPFDELGLVRNDKIDGYTLKVWLPYSSKVTVKKSGQQEKTGGYEVCG